MIKQLKHCEQSSTEAGKIRFAIQGPRSDGISYILIPGLSSYPLGQQNSSSFDHYNPQTIWERTSIANGKDIFDWERVGQHELMLKLVNHFLVKHFGQASDTPFANIHCMESNAEFQETLLNGTFVQNSSLPPAANTLLKSFATSEPSPPIPLLPTWKEFCSFIDNSKERRSCSPSNRRYGHYKSLLHSAPSILKGIFKILSIALQCVGWIEDDSDNIALQRK